jgi:osmotically-inducible protein OsmY
LSHAFPNLTRAEVQIAIDDGVVTLWGFAPDVTAKRQVEAIARSTPGVIDVENLLVTDSVTTARVTAALDTDPQTELSCIEVVNELGVVTLKGQVDSLMIRETAGKIASQQRGVTRVINDLCVEADAYTDCLKRRQLAPWMRTPREKAEERR